MPLSGNVSFVMNTDGKCMILPESFGFIKYAGHIKTSDKYYEAPKAIYTTEINRTKTNQLQDISRKLINNGQVYATIARDYSVNIIDPAKR